MKKFGEIDGIFISFLFCLISVNVNGAARTVSNP